MPQLDLITFITQFSGALIGLALIGFVLLWGILPRVKASLRIRQQGSAPLNLPLSQKETLAKKILQLC